MSILTTQPAAETVIIGCDSGNKLIKTRNTVTLAGIERLPAKPAVSPPDPMDILLIDSLYYSISNTRLRYEPDKSINDNHLYLTLIAIAKELRARGMSPKNEIILAAGLPPGHMSSAKLAENYRNYFLRNGGMFRFQCGGVPHQINIKDVVVCPQAYSILLTLSPDVIKMPSVYVIDIGGGTVDSVHLVNGRPDPMMNSLEMGVIPMYSTIQKQMQNEFRRQISEDQVDNIIMGKPHMFKPEHVEVVKRTADAHIHSIFDRFREMGDDWLSGYVVFCGGGSVLLKEYIARYAPELTGRYLIVEDIRANGKGFETFARVKLKSRK
ncbi:ParM/StbA family protein [Anaerotruncus colihominis]|uniref:ParM/StbA family protein n=1 Tax=Anaerotruncus colihominis TaxID=169435 RepID=A0A845SZK2_9FIRM|nr:ParM/StbA family protein [Anaerotruncus colihominis]NDO37711.1 ParM/StbA family protein [Anaerotruncus colihominis]